MKMKRLISWNSERISVLQLHKHVQNESDAEMRHTKDNELLNTPANNRIGDIGKAQISKRLVCTIGAKKKFCSTDQKSGYTDDLPNWQFDPFGQPREPTRTWPLGLSSILFVRFLFGGRT